MIITEIDPEYSRPIKLSSWSLSGLERRAALLQKAGYLVYRPIYVEWWSLRYAIKLLPILRRYSNGEGIEAR